MFSLENTSSNNDSVNASINKKAYIEWREKKLSAYPAAANDLLVPISSMGNLDDEERQQIVKRCNTYNMAVYQTNELDVSTDLFRQFAENFGLFHLDHHLCTEDNGISELIVANTPIKEEFIPYSNRPIGWHTDGYYNPDERRIWGLMLHCVNPAIDGGINALMDHELAYILLRDKNPDFIKALMAPDCMTIPAHMADGVERRPVCTGPVFHIDPSSGKLHMRYTARKRNIIWKDDKLVTDAIAYLTELFSAADSPIITHTLEAGQGVITNNVLHIRTGFTDEHENRRLLYRGRFFDWVS
ncbi:MAG: TauD/TfdA family dioxygenase [Gammaproteobacteria bacterium]|nr:TauD/TfdA family dioxygenase [Gammaproteobacteria bacterium]